MRKLLLAGAATFGLLAAPAVLSAQEAEVSADVAAEVELTTEQQATYDAWPADRRAEYDALESEYQTYFWTLTPRQQDAFWVLTPEQRTQILEMTPQARANAWPSIEAQLAAGANNSETSVAARTGGDVSAAPQTAREANAQAAPPPPTVTSGAGVIERNYPGNLTPPPPSALNKEYPVCTAQLQDSCQNPGEGGAPGVSRALPYWPGEPASERN